MAYLGVDYITISC